jgi:omega-6 fatty acid desaturase (delta-12 desaturase)
VQHQFERASWQKEPEWTFHEAALWGSSFYDLPLPLRWISANIGIHHVHHLCSRIPNYRLAETLRALPELRAVNRFSLRDSLRMFHLALWDPDLRKLIAFRDAHRGERERPFLDPSRGPA